MIQQETLQAAPVATIDWRTRLMAFARTREGMLSGLVVVGVILCFWPLFIRLPSLWSGKDGYYSHGFLVPFIVGYVIYRWWPRIKDIPPKAGWFAVVPLAAILFFMRPAFVSGFLSVLSIEFMVCLALGVWLVAGFRWMLALALPVAYLSFALPLWGSVIDVYTNPLQIYSTKVAYQFLQLANYHPFMQDSTTIYLNQFTLNVEVPCSGLKLVLAVGAFTAFFMMIGNLKWWGNVMMVAIVLPLCLFINGLRITLIGMVGDGYGADAGHTFHDYSGYITLIVCFFILFKFARLIGWKD